jgi:ParB family chromosome partitioning protein
LLAFGNASSEGRIMNLPIESIKPNPYQPRKIFDEQELLSLSLSIARNGLIQPLIVRRTNEGDYELVAGERRIRAAKMAGLTKLPCIVSRMDTEQSSVVALIENLQRSDLDFFEEAYGYRRLIDSFGLTQESVAQRVGRSQSAIANKIRLLRLSDNLVSRIRGAGLSERHARALLKLEDTRREQTLDYVIENHLNVEKTEEYIDRLIQAGPIAILPKRKAKPLIKDIRFFFNTVNRAVDLIKQSGIEAVCGREELEDSYKITILVPKNR